MENLFLSYLAQKKKKKSIKLLKKLKKFMSNINKIKYGNWCAFVKNDFFFW